MRHHTRVARLLRIAVSVLLPASALFAFASGDAAELAHPRGALKVATLSPRAGDSLAVSGRQFAGGDILTIALVGVTGRIPLGEAPTDTAGAFRRSFLIPASAKLGAWRLAAEAIDGDEVASLDLNIVAGTAATPMELAMPSGMKMDMKMHMQMDMKMDAAPTGAPLELSRARSGIVTGVAWALIVTCAFAGAVLLRAPRTNPEHQP